MKLRFGFGNKEENKEVPKGLKGATILKEMKDKIMEFVAAGETDRDEVKEYSTVFMTNCDKAGMQPTFSCIGNRKSLIEMLHAAALEDEEFGKILVTATEAAIFKSDELTELQQQLKRSGNKVSKIMKDGSSKKGTKMNLSDLGSMTEEDIIALAKRMAEDRDND